VSGTGSKCSFSKSESVEMEWDNFSRMSHKSKASVISKQSSLNSDANHTRLVRLINEVDAPVEFADLLAQHLLGLVNKDGMADRGIPKNYNIASAVTHLVKLFQRWARFTPLTVLALDDVHFMDEVSWQVVQTLVQSTRNFLVVCTSRPLNNYKLTVNPEFWEELNGKFKAEGRYVYIELHRLGENDIRAMIAKRLNLDEHEIDESFHRDVYTQSGGMPAFANEILQSASRRNSIGRQVNNRMGWTASDRGKGELTHASVGDMIVHRLDNFDQLVRVVLNLGAVLGSSFELRDIINVTHRFANKSVDVQTGYSQKIVNALNFLVSEGILLEECLGGEDDGSIINVVLATEPEESADGQSLAESGSHYDGQSGLSNDLVELDSFNTSKFQDKNYTFCHDVWRTSILNLMLESRKKQIHSIIATSLETHARTKAMDYGSQMKVWHHWKAAGETGKAANLALSVGKRFEELGLHDQSIKLYEDTLELMKEQDSDAADGIGGMCVCFRFLPHDEENCLHVFSNFRV
jgi:hypothetical protein